MLLQDIFSIIREIETEFYIIRGLHNWVSIKSLQ